MRAIYQTMLHLRDRQAQVPRSQQARTRQQPLSLLAATLLQLRTEDVLVTQDEYPLATEVLALAHGNAFNPDVLPTALIVTENTAVAALAAGYALAQSRYSHPGDHAPVTVALLRPDAPIDEAMRIAGEFLLPLILITREDPSFPRKKVQAPANVEAILIDGEDAVACCRVMQESLLRARNRWGSVVLRAVSLPGTPDALVSMRERLHRRNIQIP